MQIKTHIAGLLAACSLMACAPLDLDKFDSFLPKMERPAMGWDKRPEAFEWTSRSLAAVASKDEALALRIPADIKAWCPGYEKASLPERRAFWAGLLSAVAKYESNWNPRAAGGGGRYIGVMQISPKTAQNYRCTARSSSALKDGAANLECAVEILSAQVARDGVVAGQGNKGIGRDWGPLRYPSKRAAMSQWTRSQSYCG